MASSRVRCQKARVSSQEVQGTAISLKNKRVAKLVRQQIVGLRTTGGGRASARGQDEDSFTVELLSRMR